MSPGEIVGLSVYALQQLGMTLGVGAQTVLLASYFKNKDASPDESPLRQARSVVRFSLWIIVLSGIVITGAHFLVDEMGTVFEAAFLFKWLLIALVLIFGIVGSLGMLPRGISIALGGATWYALFALHTLAPASIGWMMLGTLYGGWLVVFGLLFTVVSMIGKFGSSNSEPAFATAGASFEKNPPATPPPPKPVPPPSRPAPPPPPKPIPAVPTPPKPLAPPSPPKPIVPPPLSRPTEPKVEPPTPKTPPAPPVGLPANYTPSTLSHIHTMPRSPEEVKVPEQSDIKITPW